MSTFSRLSRFGGAVKKPVSLVWKASVVVVTLGRRWLLPRRRTVSWGLGITVVMALLIGFIIAGGASWYGKNHEAIAPLLTLAAGLAVAAVALIRHFAQTDADRQRRITESYSKAVEQLASDKIEIRLGGIYTLERISRESLDDYWTVMVTLCAFVRERARRKALERACSETVARFYGMSDTTETRTPPTDIAATLAVIVRREERGRKREREVVIPFKRGQVTEELALGGMALDLHEADLSGANFSAAFGRADFRQADLRGTDLSRATLSGVDLRFANLDRANLSGAVLWATLLSMARLTITNFSMADCLGADFRGANLEGADLREAQNLSERQLSEAIGDALTQLPIGLTRPSGWPRENLHNS
jgi:uncharacterized protein YjbI with pentapeptide repeats